MVVSVHCRKTGELLLTGELLVENQFCVSVEKTYPNGKIGAETYLKSDVLLVDTA